MLYNNKKIFIHSFIEETHSEGILSMAIITRIITIVKLNQFPFIY